MTHDIEQAVLLFSYGTLQDKAVQLSNFGRELKGRPDTLPGYTQQLVEITDPRCWPPVGKPIIPSCRRAPTCRMKSPALFSRLPSRN